MSDMMTVVFGRRECDSVEVDRDTLEIVRLMHDDAVGVYGPTAVATDCVTQQLFDQGYEWRGARAITLLAKSSK